MTGTTIVVAVALLATACARHAPQPKTAAPQARLLFVQSARGVSFEGGQLTLHGVSPATLFFTDRPQRIAGHVPTRRFLAEWERGKDSFAADPPNATLSVLGARGVGDAVVELSRPRLHGQDLVYQARIIEGAPPRRGGPSSLFIDDAARLGAPAFLARPDLYRPEAWDTYVYDPYASTTPMPPPSSAGTGPYGDLTTPSYYGANPYAEGWRDAPPQAYTFE